MTVINTNVGALTARTYAVKATANTETAMERLSSGLRINSAADDAAGLAVANKMESQLRGMNMAIRNSQDGISLVQTAEAAMGEVNNMAIRMRELAVQMNNGVYTDSDRANAQLEVTALLAEIDKIANNAAFNEVKILDGTYSQDIRAGNTNPEIINVSIDRMNTDSLGGANLAGTSSVATGNNSTDLNSEARTSINVTEADKVTIKQTSLASGLQSFASTHATDGAYALANAPTGWAIDSSTGEITKSTGVAYDTTNSANNTITLDVVYTGKTGSGAATQTFTDKITISVADNTGSAVVKGATSALTTNESANVSFRSVDSLNPGAATDGQLSNAMQAFVSADSYGGTWTLGGNDAGDFTIDASGVVTATLDFESPADTGADNTYNFTVKYTSSTGDEFTETVSLAVTDGDEEVHTLAGFTDRTNAGKGSTYTVTVDGQTITAEKSTATSTVNATAMAQLLNDANSLRATADQARGTFSANAGNTEVIFTFNDSVGNYDQVGGALMTDITERRADTLTFTGVGDTAQRAGVNAVAEITEVSGISGVLNAAVAGDTFDITVAGTTITATVPSGITAGQFSVADLASALNTANTSVAVTFGNNNDKLTITADTAGASFTAVDFERNNIAVGTITETTPAVTAVAFAQGIDSTVATGATVAANDELVIVIDGTEYSAAVTANTVAAFNTALNSALSGTVYSASAGDAGALPGGGATGDANNDVIITTSVTGTAGTFSVDDLFIRVDSSNGVAVAGAASTATTEGSNSNAFAGASPTSGNRNATPDTAIATLNGNFGSRTAAMTEVSSAKNTITLSEAATVKFGTDAMSSAMQNYAMAVGQTGGTYSLSGTDKASFEINSNTGLVENKVNMDFETKASYSFNVVYTDKNGDTFTDEVTLNLTDSTVDNVQHIADVNLSTQGGASSAIGILDSAINQISASQAKLGAIQNRLEHNIDNLSMASMLTETSKGRIIDADFAAETSELSKQQILAQAATSMLAQANQSKQSVLALLQ